MTNIGDFEWWFSGEYGRDRILRERYESVQADASAAFARTSRLSSQLSQLQGSIEARLNALSAAFDAYVELGDVREQLTPYADSAAVRRDAMAAIAALGAGRPAPQVDDRATGYWIAPATNAVSARAAGRPDDATEEALTARHPEAELFMVAAAGAIGRGAEVAHRVPGCLQPVDGRLDAHQQALWRAVLSGRYGDRAPQQVLSAWSEELSDDPAGWWQWASDEASAAELDVLDWIAAQPGGPSSLPQPDLQAESVPDQSVPDQSVPDQSVPDQSVQSGDIGVGSGLRDLQQIVMELISAGDGEERALISRARELRARIESPDSARSQPSEDAGHPGPNEDRSPTGVLEMVRTSYRQTPPGSPGREAIIRAVVPGLSAAVEAEAPRLLTAEPAITVVRIGGTSVPVGPEGPDRDALARAKTSAAAEPADGRLPLYAAAGTAALAAVVGLIAAIASVNTGVVVFLLLLALIGAGIALRFWLRERRERQDQVAEEQRNAARFEQAQQRVSTIEQEQRSLVQARAVQLDKVRISLGALSDVRPG